MKFIIAPNTLKHSVDAITAAELLAKGITKSSDEHEVMLLPVADGGDLTMEIVTRHMSGIFKKVSTFDALMHKKEAAYGWIEDQHTAVIDVASASGIAPIPAELRDPLNATSYGTGVLLKDAFSRGARRIIIGMGGSATVDGGLGILQALGVKFLDQEGSVLENPLRDYKLISTVSLESVPDELNYANISLLADVTNPLLGEKGAARVFGPQKGAEDQDIQILEDRLSHLNSIFTKIFQKDTANLVHAGAAGGIGAGLHAVLGAHLYDGAQFILDLLEVPKVFDGAGILISCEGKLDSQTLGGKAPSAVTRAAKNHGLETIMLAGHIDSDFVQPDYMDAVFSLSPGVITLEEALSSAPEQLVRLGYQIGRLYR